MSERQTDRRDKKVGIMTMHRKFNFGSALQTYALQRTILKLGYDCDVIDYLYPNSYHIGKNIPQPVEVSRLAKVKDQIGRYLTSQKERECAFSEFMSGYIKLSKEQYPTIESLLQSPPQYDIYVSGSDQVWNTKYLHEDPTFLLKFAPQDAKRISYAASFGNSSLDQRHAALYRDNLQKFSSISVRESSGVQIVADLIDRQSQVVLDPTFLLSADDWMPLAIKPELEGPYILCYFLHYTFNPQPYADMVARQISKATGYKLVFILPDAYKGKMLDPRVHTVFRAGPREFLGWFANAEIVLTTSFHGTAFSINFEKRFLSIVDDAPTLDCRQKSLLEELDMRDQILPMSAPLPDLSRLQPGYAESNKLLETARRKSFEYLCDSLGTGAFSSKVDPGPASKSSAKNAVELCPENECTGCAACLSSCPTDAISMMEDREGFLVPCITREKCTTCGLCRKSCPILTDSCATRSESPQTYAAWSSDESIRTDSSSGGVFSVLASHVLAQSGVVFGAAFNTELKLQHHEVKNSRELRKLRGSKYLQSDIGKTYVEIRGYLERGCHAMFVGTPCQVAGLYGYLGKDYSNLTTCDLVCHGVPSQRFFDEYLHYLRHNGYPRFDDVSFRNKKSWRHATILAESSSPEKEISVDRHHDYYQRAFLKRLISRRSCYTCKYARLPRTGDFTLGDFWGLGIEVPFLHDTGKGVSLLLVNSGHGSEMLGSCSNDMFLEERELSEAKKMNLQLHKASGPIPARDFFLADMKSLSPEAVVAKYGLRKKLSWREAVHEAIRFAIGPSGAAFLKKHIGVR